SPAPPADPVRVEFVGVGLSDPLTAYHAAYYFQSVALFLNPGNAEAHFRRGLAYDRVGLGDLALADFDAAARLRPGHAETHHERGVILAEQRRDWPAAEAAFARVVELDPGWTRAWYDRGLCRAHQQRWAEAVDDFGRVLAEWPGYEYARSTRAK